MEQYHCIKNKYKDTILLFRVGDFYEIFENDAIICSKILNITLTKRSNGSAYNVNLSGFPFYVLENYLPKILNSGLRVAICEQIETSEKNNNNIIKRNVTEIITPGVNLNYQFNKKTNNFIASIYYKNNIIGLSLLDFSTGEFFLTEGNIEYIKYVINNFSPNEIIYREKCKKHLKKYLNLKHYYTYIVKDWMFQKEIAYEKLISHFKTNSLKGFDIENLNVGIISAAAILNYLYDMKYEKLDHISKISKIEQNKYIWISNSTLKNLEIIKSINDNGKSLIDIMDKTITSMGSRLLKRWIILPIKNINKIKKRQKILLELLNNKYILNYLKEKFEKINDIEKLISKISTRKINLHEIKLFCNSLESISSIKNKLLKSNNEILIKLGENIKNCNIIINKIKEIILYENFNISNNENIICNGVSKKLDLLKNKIKNENNKLKNLYEFEKKRLNIKNIKISFNKIIGYYIEIKRNNKKLKIPNNWTRKQILSNNTERYIIKEFKYYEFKIIGIKDEIHNIEKDLFMELVLFINKYINDIQLNAKYIAYIDVLYSFSISAIENNYICPIIDDSLDLYIEGGRHPVIEKQLPIGIKFVSNNIFLNKKDQQIIVITGPNMSGKSALLRQTALIVLMAQIGSYVPAKYVKFGWIDKIFSRIGSSDNISIGESTFMVEMNETASILNNISERSLLILDEIGRGTSNHDGISIAWSIIEFLHNNKNKPKTLFATHYHELSEMNFFLKRVKNYNIYTKKFNEDIIFMRKLIPGPMKNSFGIHIAKIAGVPNEIINRSNYIIKILEKYYIKNSIKNLLFNNNNNYLNNFTPKIINNNKENIIKYIYYNILKLDINRTTPIKSLFILNNLKKYLINNFDNMKKEN